jgi:membrane protease YdiL (CAAX protease family)
MAQAPQLLGDSVVAHPRAVLGLGSLLLATPTLLAVLAFLGRSWRRTLALQMPGRSTLLLSALLGGALWVLSVGVMEVQSLFYPPSPEIIELFRRLHQALAPRNPVEAVLSVLAIAILPALSEELVLRGVLLPALRGPFGSAGAVFGSSLVFALLHDPVRLVFTFVVGLVLGLMRLRSGSLWPPILGHATLNTLTFLVAPLVDDPTQTTYTPQPVLGVACLLVGAALVVPVLRALRRSVDSPGTHA